MQIIKINEKFRRRIFNSKEQILTQIEDKTKTRIVKMSLNIFCITKVNNIDIGIDHEFRRSKLRTYFTAKKKKKKKRSSSNYAETKDGS